MGKYKRYKNRLEKFLAGDNGKRFFNIAYSLGAAIVILGALFKILHLPLGNLMLSIGMGTEVIMFCLSAFDKPGKEYNWEEVFPVLTSKDPEDRPEGFRRGGSYNNNNMQSYSAAPTTPIGTYAPQQQQQQQQRSNQQPSTSASQNTAQNVAPQNAAPQATGYTPAIPQTAAPMATGVYPAQQPNMLLSDTEMLQQAIEKMSLAAEQLSGIATQMAKIGGIANDTQEIGTHTQGYVTQMEALNRNISGLNTIYEIQLKSISSQIDTIDKVNIGLGNIKDMFQNSTADSEKFKDESEKMTRQISELNLIYERMLQAMTINLK